MLRPSYAELMDTLNQEREGDEVTSRYTIVIAAAKRARQLIDGDAPMTAAVNGKPVSTAVKELNEGKIKIVPEGEGTVLHLKKSYDLQEEINSDLSHMDDEPLFDFTTMPDNEETNEDDDEFEEDGISESMIEEEGEF